MFYTLLIDVYQQRKTGKTYEHAWLVKICLVVLWLGFVTGIVSFGVFAMINYL